MNQKNALIAVAILVVAIAAAGLTYFYQSWSEPTDNNSFSEAQVLDRLAEEWSQLEQGPLKHEAEGGHWFLNEVQFISSSTVIAWYEDGLNDEFAVLTYHDNAFDVRITFRDRSNLDSIRSTYGTVGYPPSIYSYDNDLGRFTAITQSSVFDGSGSTPPPPTADGTVSRVKLAFLNPDGTLPNEVKEGDISGCDHVVLREREIEPTQAPLTAALNLLLAEEGGWSESNKVYNYIGQGDLRLSSVTITDGTARIYLLGTPPTLGGVCDDPRLFVQVAQTARQFPTVQRVELFVNGRRNTGTSNEQG